MSRDANAEFGPQFFMAQDRLKGGPDEALCAQNYTAQIGTNPIMPLAGHQQFARVFYAGFPDIRHTFDDIVADDDRVAVRFTLRGTHQGDFMGLPATGRTVTIPAVAVIRVSDGRAVELRAVFDEMGLMRQLGVVK